MSDILGLANGDNFVTSIECGTSLNIYVEKWNGIKCYIVGMECCKLLVNSTVEFEIGEIAIKNAKEFSDAFEKDVVSENNDFLEYEELIIYDAWIPNRVNMRAIAKSFNIADCI